MALSAVLLLAPAASGAARKSADGTFVQTTTFRMSEPDEKRRGAVVCPGGKTVTPLGGGMSTSPAPGPDGEGVYPHSYERLGAQRGFHVTPVLYDPSPAHTTPRDVTLQVVCGPKSSHIAPIRNTVYVNPGETKTAEATCPGKRRLFSGGFQRTNFVTRGGNYVTGSRAISDKTWQVTGSAFGKFGGELTAIAYCRSSGKPLVTEVSARPRSPPRSTGRRRRRLVPASASWSPVASKASRRDRASSPTAASTPTGPGRLPASTPSARQPS